MLNNFNYVYIFKHSCRQLITFGQIFWLKKFKKKIRKVKSLSEDIENQNFENMALLQLSIKMYR